MSETLPHTELRHAMLCAIAESRTAVTHDGDGWCFGIFVSDRLLMGRVASILWLARMISVCDGEYAIPTRDGYTQLAEWDMKHPKENNDA